MIYLPVIYDYLMVTSKRFSREQVLNSPLTIMQLKYGENHGE